MSPSSKSIPRIGAPLSILLALFLCVGCRTIAPTKPASTQVQYNTPDRFTDQEQAAIIAFAATCGLTNVASITTAQTFPTLQVGILVHGKERSHGRKVAYEELGFFLRRWEKNPIDPELIKRETNGVILAWQTVQTFTTFRIHGKKVHAHLDESVPLRVADSLLRSFFSQGFDRIRPDGEPTSRLTLASIQPGPSDDSFELEFMDEDVEPLVYTLTRDPITRAIALDHVTRAHI